MEYTKGKWKVDPDFEWVMDEEGRIVANCTGHMDAKANAHLIAAAPDLYEALWGMVKAWEELHPDLHANLAKLALAKVEEK